MKSGSRSTAASTSGAFRCRNSFASSTKCLSRGPGNCARSSCASPSANILPGSKPPMAILESTISTGGAAYKANRAGMLALIARMRMLEERTRAASAGAKDRFHKRGQLLPRERVALALDPGAPFIELSTLAGYMFDVPDANKSVPGGGVIAGIGFVSGVRCMVSANDSGIDAGALQAFGLDKTLRVQELALENKLPYVQLVESAGANLLRYRVEDFVRGGNIFRNLARLSAAGLPVVTVTHGSSPAGGACQTGLSDCIVMVRGRTRAFLAGPPLLKAATGEVATEEELGGAEMHTGVSGLGEYLAEDDRHALGIARDVVARLGSAPTPALPQSGREPNPGLHAGTRESGTLAGPS